MDCRTLWLLSLVALAAGCKSNENLALLEAENRRLEDRVFQLESDLCQHCDLLDSLESENLSLRGSSKRDSDNDDTYSGDLDDHGGPPRIDPGTPDTDIDTGPAPRFDGGAAPKLPRSDRPQRLFPVGLGGPVPSPADLAHMRAASAEVTRITLDRMSADGDAAKGLVVVVEPRDGAGQLLKATGDLSVVVLDGSRPDDAARLARWDFTPAEAASRFRRTALGERMHLDLTWPDAPPPGSNLRLFVRFSTSDGRKLIADVPIELPGTPAAKETDRPIVATHEAETDSESETEAKAADEAVETSESDSDEDEVQPFPAADADADDRPLTTRRPRPKPTWSPYR